MGNSLESLYEWPKDRILKVLIALGFIVLAAISLFIMNPIETELKSTSGYGVMELEFMWTPATAEAIMKAWGADLIAKELYVTYWDMGYLVSYACLFSSLNLYLARKLALKGIIASKSKKHVVIGAIFPLIAAFFDVVENVNIIIVLRYPENLIALNTMLVSLCASLKFGLLFLCWGWLLMALIRLFVKKIK